MKIVLLALSGNSGHDQLTHLFPDAVIESISRGDFENGSLMKRLVALRARRPDVFAIATERLAWQRGQDLFMIFGALAGAREVVMIDAHGGIRRESRFDLLAGAPAALANEAVTGLNDLLQSKRELLTLEREKPGSLSTKTDRPRIVYLRATPGPGTQAGGAASHIKGVVEALANSALMSRSSATTQSPVSTRPVIGSRSSRRKRPVRRARFSIFTTISFSPALRCRSSSG